MLLPIAFPIPIAAIAGKWQLSFLCQRNTISDFGFDQYQCWQIFRADGSKARRLHQPYFIQNGEIVADSIAERHGSDVNIEFLSGFIRESVRKKKPFLAYNTSLLPQYPWVPAIPGCRPPTARIGRIR